MGHAGKLAIMASLLLQHLGETHADTVRDICTDREEYPCYDLNLGGFPSKNVAHMNEANAGIFLRAASFAISDNTEDIGALKFTETHQLGRVQSIIKGTHGVVLTRIDGYYYQLPADRGALSWFRIKALPTPGEQAMGDLHENGQRIDFVVQNAWAYKFDKQGNFQLEQQGVPCVVSPHGVRTIEVVPELSHVGSAVNAIVNLKFGTNGAGPSSEVGGDAKGASVKVSSGSMSLSSVYTAKFGVSLFAVEKYSCSLKQNSLYTISELDFSEEAVRNMPSKCKCVESGPAPSGERLMKAIICADKKNN